MGKQLGVADVTVAIFATMLVLYLISIIIVPPYTIIAMGIVFLLMTSAFFMIEYDRDRPIINIFAPKSE